MQCKICNCELSPVLSAKTRKLCAKIECYRENERRRYEARKPKPVAPTVPALALIPKPVAPPASQREAIALARFKARQARELDLTSPAVYRAPSLAAAEAITQVRNVAVNRSECLTGGAGAVRHAVGGVINAS